MVELKSNYPRYNILIRTSEKEEDILARIRRKAKRMENILGESFETNPDKAFISIQGNEGNHTRYKVNSQATSPPESRNDRIMSCETENKPLGESSQPAFETANARSEGTQSEGEQDCTECLITGQNFSFSRYLDRY